MFAFLFHPDNLVFAIPLGLMVAMAMLEFVTTILGFSLSALIHSIIPDFHLDFHLDHDFDVNPDLDLGADAHVGPDFHMDTDAHLDTHLDGHGLEADHGDAHHGLDLGQVRRRSRMARFLWGLGIGRIPILVILVLFLFAFGLSGLFFQFIVLKITGTLINGWFLVLPALVVSLVLLRIVGAALTRILPKAGGQAISEKTFIGRVAQISIGTACFGCPAQAKLKDGYGQTHYVMVQPDQEGVIFETGQSILLIDRQGAVFTGVASPIEAADDMPPAPPVDDDDEDSSSDES